jgi:hypothetical protein
MMNRMKRFSWTPNGAVLAGSCLLVLPLLCFGQTVVASARVVCGVGQSWESSGPIAGALINQTNTVITDVEMELSIVARDAKGVLKRQRDTRFVVVPSLNEGGMVTKLESNGEVYFNIPGKDQGLTNGLHGGDRTCGGGVMAPNELRNVATIAITRINGKYLVAKGQKASLDSMLRVPPEFPVRAPTQSGLIKEIREKNALLYSSIINNQLQDCLSRGTWACSFNNDTNINVVISQK